MALTAKTTVELANGSIYEIPVGAPLTFPWVRQASLIAVAYRQVEDFANADRWQREYDKRRRMWEQAEAGEDLQAIIRTASPDLLAPLRILYDVGAGVARTVERAADTVLDWGDVLPWLLGGVVVVAGVAAYRGNLGYVTRRR